MTRVDANVDDNDELATQRQAASDDVIISVFIRIKEAFREMRYEPSQFQSDPELMIPHQDDPRILECCLTLEINGFYNSEGGGVTPLHIAVDRSLPRVLKRLIRHYSEKGWSVDEVDYLRRTPLMYLLGLGVRYCQDSSKTKNTKETREMAMDLLRAGADPLRPDQASMTAFHYATLHNMEVR